MIYFVRMTKEFKMPTCTLQLRLDADLRKEADELFTRAGMDLSSAVRLFLRQSIIRRRLPFDVVTENPDPFWSDANQRGLRESIASLERGEGGRSGSSGTASDRKFPPWAGTAVPHIHVTPGMKHDMASIREDIGRGIAQELAERERGEGERHDLIDP